MNKMIFKQICSRFKLLFLSIIGIFRRALCCFSRRRRFSTSDESSLDTLTVIKDNGPRCKYNEQVRDWNSWDDSPRTVEEHIEQYRQKLVRSESVDEPEPDFFQDMTPKIKPQPVLYIQQQENQLKTNFSRLEAKNVPIPISSELEDWTEEGGKGWEELNAEETKQLIREKRKELRLQRQQKQLRNSPGVGVGIGIQRISIKPS